MSLNVINYSVYSRVRRFVVRGLVTVAPWSAVIGSTFGYTTYAQSVTSQAVPLWQGLAKGMSPEEALPILGALEGIKDAKVRGRAADSERLRIRYDRDGILLAHMRFELAPQFENNQLNQIWLRATGQCTQDALPSFSALSEALLAKYPERISGPETMRSIDVNRATLRSMQTGALEPITYGFANGTVVVLLTYAFKSDAAPEYPVGGGTFARDLWQISRTAYEQRRSECNGTGHERMAIGLQYLARSDYDRDLQHLQQEHHATQQELTDQL